MYAAVILAERAKSSKKKKALVKSKKRKAKAVECPTAIAVYPVPDPYTQ